MTPKLLIWERRFQEYVTTTEISIYISDGALMLAPIYNLLFAENKNDRPSLELTEDRIAISYKTYKSYDADDMQKITDEKLTPGIITRKYR